AAGHDPLEDVVAVPIEVKVRRLDVPEQPGELGRDHETSMSWPRHPRAFERDVRVADSESTQARNLSPPLTATVISFAPVGTSSIVIRSVRAPSTTRMPLTEHRRARIPVIRRLRG